MAFAFELTPEQQKLRALAQELAQDFALRASEHDRDRSAPIENYKKLQEAGLYHLVIPKAYGGGGAKMLDWQIVAQELAKGCASTALSFNMHVGLCGTVFYGSMFSEEAKRRVARWVVEEGKLLCGTNSEPSSSSHVPSSFVPTLQAHEVPSGYRLIGQKAFATMWEAADLAVVFAHPAHDVNPLAGVVLAIPTKGKGVTVHDEWHTIGMRATRSQRVTLDGALAPRENLLLQTDTITSVVTLTWGFGGYTAVYLGLGQAIYETAKQLVTNRKVKGYSQVMAYHPDIRRRMSQLACTLEAAELMMYKAALKLDTEGDNRTTFLALLKAKHLVGQAVAVAAHEAADACGLHGLMSQHPLERMIRDAQTATIQPPNSDVCLSMIGLLEMGLNPDEIMPGLRPARPVEG